LSSVAGHTFNWITSNTSVLVLLATLAASLSLNVGLGWRVQALTATRRALRPGGIRVGTTLTSIPVLDRRGQRGTISFRGQPQTVLYVMSPLCAWCEKDYDNIRVLAAERGSGFRFVGLSTTADKLDQYLLVRPLPFEVYVAGSRGLPNLDLSATPQTVVVRPDGVVDEAWVGALSAERRDEAERFFGLKLPGIRDHKDSPPH